MEISGINKVSYYKSSVNVSAEIETDSASVKLNVSAERDAFVSSAEAVEKSSENSSLNNLYNQYGTMDRTEIVEAMKSEQEAQQQRLIDMIRESLGLQASKVKAASSSDISEISKEDIQKEAQESISEDGYWGVKKTSERIFNFALALSGGDIEVMKQLQEAAAKGYSQATDAWGSELPAIAAETMTAVNELFEHYYNSHEA